jgi:hypothetical protein
LHWNNLTSVPAGLSDGDDNTIYGVIIGGGLRIDGTNKFGLITSGCSSGQVLKFNGSGWTCSNDNGSTYTAASSLTLNSGQFALNTANPNTWTAAGTQTFNGVTTMGAALNMNYANAEINHPQENTFFINSYESMQLRINSSGGQTGGNFKINNSSNNPVLSMDNGGNVTIAGKAYSTTPVSSDPVNTVATKGYVDAAVSGGVTAKWAGNTGGFQGNFGNIIGANNQCRASYPSIANVHWCSLEEIDSSLYNPDSSKRFNFGANVWVKNLVFGPDGDGDRCFAVIAEYDHYYLNGISTCPDCGGWTDNLPSPHTGLYLNTSAKVAVTGCSSSIVLPCCY